MPSAGDERGAPLADRAGRGQRPAIDLAVGGRRQRIEQHEGGGDHVVGQRGGESVPAVRSTAGAGCRSGTM